MNEDIYRESFSRNIGIFSEEEQEKLKKIRIAIAGVGGAGSNAMYGLVRAGVCNFSIADPDVYVHSNLNRQFGATLQAIGEKKVDAIEKTMKTINQDLDIRKFPEGLHKDNIEDFLKDADVVINAIEYLFLDKHKDLFDRARQKGLYVFFPPAFGLGAALAVFSPKGPSYEEFFGAIPEKLDQNYVINFGQKLFPIIPGYINKEAFIAAMQRKRPIPTFGPAVMLAGINTATDIILYILGKREPVCVPKVKWIDLYEQTVRVIDTQKQKWSLRTKIRLLLGLMSAR